MAILCLRSRLAGPNADGHRSARFPCGWGTALRNATQLILVELNEEGDALANSIAAVPTSPVRRGSLEPGSRVDLGPATAPGRARLGGGLTGP